MGEINSAAAARFIAAIDALVAFVDGWPVAWHGNGMLTNFQQPNSRKVRRFNDDSVRGFDALDATVGGLMQSLEIAMPAADPIPGDYEPYGYTQLILAGNFARTEDWNRRLLAMKQAAMTRAQLFSAPAESPNTRQYDSLLNKIEREALDDKHRAIQERAARRSAMEQQQALDAAWKALTKACETVGPNSEEKFYVVANEIIGRGWCAWLDSMIETLGPQDGLGRREQTFVAVLLRLACDSSTPRGSITERLRGAGAWASYSLGEAVDDVYQFFKIRRQAKERESEQGRPASAPPAPQADSAELAIANEAANVLSENGVPAAKVDGLTRAMQTYLVWFGWRKTMGVAEIRNRWSSDYPSMPLAVDKAAGSANVRTGLARAKSLIESLKSSSDD